MIILFLLMANEQIISIGEMIQQAIDQSTRSKILQKELSLAKINLDQRKSEIFYPELSLKFNIDHHAIYKDEDPRYQMGIQLQKYTLFNWGKDRQAYAIEESKFLNEETRIKYLTDLIRLETIDLYTQLIYSLEEVKILQEKFEHSNYLLRLNKERLSNQKISVIDYYQTRDQFLISEEELNEAKDRLRAINGQIALLLSAPENRINYRTDDLILFRPLTLKGNALLEMAMLNNKQLKILNEQLKIAQIEHSLDKLDTVVLPSINLSLSAFTWDSQALPFRQMHKPSVEIFLNATWPIWGGNGFLNHNKLTISQNKIDLLHLQIEELTNQIKRDIYQIADQLYRFGPLINALESRYLNAKTFFDSALSEYIKENHALSNLLSALSAKSTAHLKLQQAYVKQQKLKLTLTQLMGTSNLPGEAFEQLFVKRGEQ